MTNRCLKLIYFKVLHVKQFYFETISSTPPHTRFAASIQRNTNKTFLLPAGNGHVRIVNTSQSF